MKKHRLLILISGLVLIPCTLLGSVPANFPFVKKVDRDLTSSKLYSILLDEEIWLNLNSNKSNIRIFDDKKNEVPFILSKKETFKIINESIPIDSKVVSLTHLENNSVEIIFELNTLKPINLLEIKTKVQNFEKDISVYGGPLQGDWKLLKKDKVFDYSAMINHRKLSISIPKSTYNYFKIKLDNVIEDSESPIISLSEKKGLNNKNIIQYRKTIHRKIFKVDQVVFYYPRSKLRSNSDIEMESIIPSWSAQVISKDGEHKTELVVDTVGAPLQSAVIYTKGRVYGRSMMVQTFNFDSEKWELINRLKLKTGRNNQMLIPLKRMTGKKLRFIVDNGDNQPVKITDFTLNRLLYQLVFSLDQEGKVGVYFGGDTSIVPNYDIQKYAQTQDFMFELGKISLLEFQHAKQDNKAYISGVKEPREYTFLFNSALFLLVLVLVGVIALVSKKMDGITDEKE